MITCNLKGGLGNMMFQIAAIEHASLITGYSSSYCGVHELFNLINASQDTSVMHAYEYLNIFENFNWPLANRSQKITKVPFHYVDTKFENNVTYDGFFQSEKYFPHREFILNLFSPSKSVELELKKYSDLFDNKITCSLHVRRSDYVRLQNYHPLQTLEYFTEAQKIIGKVDRYLVFSDDLNWCKENFIGDRYVFIQTSRDYYDLFLQSMCTHNIISNSSFSWWGAWLNTDPNKIVIAPTRWFGPSKKLSDADIIPQSWKKI